MQEFSFLVRVSCMTFNQASCIEDAMEGFCMQETTFPFVCVIIDDASTDGEQELINRFLVENFEFGDPDVSFQQDADYGYVAFAPHKTNRNCFFAVTLLKENHYQQKKRKYPYYKRWYFTKYFAICEGDDYWVDPLKLQKQVDYMEKHANCSLCCSDAKISEYGEVLSWKRYETDCVVPPEDIIIGGGMWLQTPTFLFRRASFNGYPDCCKNCHVGDYPLVLWAALNGDVFCFSEATAVYRHKREGSWTNKIESLTAQEQLKGWRSEIEMLKGLNAWSNGMYQDAFTQRIREYLWYIIEDYRSEAKTIWKAFSDERHTLSLRQRLRWFGYAYAPFLGFIGRKAKRLVKSLNKNG